MSIWQVQIHQTTIQSAWAGDMLEQKIDVIFKDLPNMFGIAGHLLASRI